MRRAAKRRSTPPAATFAERWFGCFIGIFHIFVVATALCAPAGYYPAEGYRHNDGGVLTAAGAEGCEWASSVVGILGYGLWNRTSAVTPAEDHSRALGFAVRCLQAFTSHFLVTAPRAPAGYYPGSGLSHYPDGSLLYVGTGSCGWTSTVVGTDAVYQHFMQADVRPVVSVPRHAHGFSVRCLQAFTLASPPSPLPPSSHKKREAVHDGTTSLFIIPAITCRERIWRRCS